VFGEMVKDSIGVNMNDRKLNGIGNTALLLMFMLVTVPAFAQIDLTGTWQSRQHEDWIERGPGPDPVDYLGLPLNDEGRAKALSYTSAQLAMAERQCLYYTPQYVVFGPQGLRIWSEPDPVTGRIIAWKISGAIDRDVLTIWMDGRPHPSENAFYPFSGFTTGVWEGDTLTTYTTHIKAGYLRRNGVPSSDKATVTEHFYRHGDLLTITAIIEDPIYLTEPHVVSRTWQLDPRANVPATSSACFPFTELSRLEEEGLVPHHLPGKNPDVDDLTRKYNIPQEAVLGHAETNYPEYRNKLKDIYTPPAMCVRYCCGWVALGGPGSAPGLSCITNGSGRLDPVTPVPQR
jgi:hypothetical protein